MSSAAIVNKASGWAKFLTRRHFRGPGDTVEAAMGRASERHNLPCSLFWTLRYRKPKDVWASTYLQLKGAYDGECQRQEDKLRHEVETMKRIMGDAADNDPVVLALDRALQTMDAERVGQ